MSGIVSKLREYLANRQQAALTDYDSLVQAGCNGDDTDPKKAAEILRQSGQSLEDLERDISAILVPRALAKELKEIKEQISKIPQVQSHLEETGKVLDQYVANYQEEKIAPLAAELKRLESLATRANELEGRLLRMNTDHAGIAELTQQYNVNEAKRSRHRDACNHAKKTLIELVEQQKNCTTREARDHVQKQIDVKQKDLENLEAQLKAAGEERKGILARQSQLQAKALEVV
jgi:hypothetical protein